MREFRSPDDAFLKMLTLIPKGFSYDNQRATLLLANFPLRYPNP